MSHRGKGRRQRCCIVGCHCTSEKCRGLSFPGLPREGVSKEIDEWRAALIRVIGRVDQSFNPARARICSRHFEEGCVRYGPSGKCSGLSFGSMPTRWMPSKTVTTPRTSRTEQDCEPGSRMEMTTEAEKPREESDIFSTCSKQDLKLMPVLKIEKDTLVDSYDQLKATTELDQTVFIKREPPDSPEASSFKMMEVGGDLSGHHVDVRNFQPDCKLDPDLCDSEVMSEPKIEIDIAEEMQPEMEPAENAGEEPVLHTNEIGSITHTVWSSEQRGSGSRNRERGKSEEKLPSKPAPRQYSCKACSASFKNMGHLNRHLRKHTGEKPYKCQECDAVYAQSEALAIHMRSHTGERPYSCEICGATFRQTGHRVTHMRRRHSQGKHKASSVLTCGECGAAFKNSSSLKTHMRKHTGERPYQCRKCGARFAASNSLTKHMRRHTGERTYVCDDCGAKFSVSFILKCHKLTHTNEKPFKCDVCDAVFRTSSSQKQHMKKHK